MNDDWVVHRGTGHLLVFTNATGETVTDVEFRLRGMAVGGKFGDRNWSRSYPVMDAGDSIQSPFRAGYGARNDPPRIEITWTSGDGDRFEVTLSDLPL